jgi:ribonuclease P protein component
MLAKKYRLSKRPDIEAVFKKGRRINHPLFVLYIMHNRLGYSRFAFPVSKKVSKKAVERNRIRRMERESVRVHYKDISAGNDVIIIATQRTLEIKKAYLLWESLRTIFKKQGLLISLV